MSEKTLEEAQAIAADFNYLFPWYHMRVECHPQYGNVARIDAWRMIDGALVQRHVDFLVSSMPGGLDKQAIRLFYGSMLRTLEDAFFIASGEKVGTAERYVASFMPAFLDAVDPEARFKVRANEANIYRQLNGGASIKRTA